jgi:hypothetical protein
MQELLYLRQALTNWHIFNCVLENAPASLAQDGASSVVRIDLTF